MRNIIHLTLPWQRPTPLQLPRTASAPDVASPKPLLHGDVFSRAERLAKDPEAAKRHLSAFLTEHPEEAPRVARFWRQHGKPYQAVAVLEGALVHQDMLAVFERQGTPRGASTQRALDFRREVAAEIQAALGEASRIA